MKKQRKQKKDQFLGASTKSKRKKIRGGEFGGDSLDEVEIGMARWGEKKTNEQVYAEFKHLGSKDDIQKIIDDRKSEYS